MYGETFLIRINYQPRLTFRAKTFTKYKDKIGRCDGISAYIYIKFTIKFYNNMRVIRICAFNFISIRKISQMCQ